VDKKKRREVVEAEEVEEVVTAYRDIESQVDTFDGKESYRGGFVSFEKLEILSCLGEDL
jgi:hypothetical protein